MRYTLYPGQSHNIYTYIYIYSNMNVPLFLSCSNLSQFISIYSHDFTTFFQPDAYYICIYISQIIIITDKCWHISICQSLDLSICVYQVRSCIHIYIICIYILIHTHIMNMINIDAPVISIFIRIIISINWNFRTLTFFGIVPISGLT